MKPVATAVAFLTLAAAAHAGDGDFVARMKALVEQNLGRPYAWGAAGVKSYDCSGFVWRMLLEDGVFLKRTTARKLYLSLPPAQPEEQYQFGSIVFFDSLKHCGIVNERSDFYHAQTSAGTTRSRFDPYWRGKICGFRTVRRTVD